LIIRDWWLCTVISVMFEVIEYTLEHQLPNFSECWWDHVGTSVYAFCQPCRISYRFTLHVACCHGSVEAVAWALSCRCCYCLHPLHWRLLLLSRKTGISDWSILAVKCSGCHNGAECLYNTHWSGGRLLWTVVLRKRGSSISDFIFCCCSQWLMDVIICNGFGIFLGMKTLNYLSMKPYHWRGMWNIPSYRLYRLTLNIGCSNKNCTEMISNL